MYFYKCSTVLPGRLADNKNCSIVYYNDACRCRGVEAFGDGESDRHAMKNNQERLAVISYREDYLMLRARVLPPQI